VKHPFPLLVRERSVFEDQSPLVLQAGVSRAAARAQGMEGADNPKSYTRMALPKFPHLARDFSVSQLE
jgi:hypothetical protein